MDACLKNHKPHVCNMGNPNAHTIEGIKHETYIWNGGNKNPYVDHALKNIIDQGFHLICVVKDSDKIKGYEIWGSGRRQTIVHINPGGKKFYGTITTVP